MKRTGRKPRTVTADRGYGEPSVDDTLHNLGVRNVVIPRKGRPTKARQEVEHRRAFRRTIKWRTGCEGRISTLKRGYPAIASEPNEILREHPHAAPYWHGLLQGALQGDDRTAGNTITTCSRR
jgi:hypothetical protein